VPGVARATVGSPRMGATKVSRVAVG